MRIVADTTPLSELYKIGHLDVLQSVYGHLIIPEAVSRELQRARTLPDLSKKVGQADWITVYPITRPDVLQALLDRHPFIHEGEAAAIALAQELDATRIILDDRRARQVAQAERLPLIGTVGVVLLAYRLGRITALQARVILDRLYGGTSYISESLYYEATQQLRD